MSEDLQGFRGKFKIEELTLYESEYWIWSLRPRQTTLGAGILSLKRECYSFSEVEKEEFCDLKNIINTIEETLTLLFNYNKINYLMLMMVDKQIHYHVIPRYENTIEILDYNWKDNSWPGIPDLTVGSLGEQQLLKVKRHIISSL